VPARRHVAFDGLGLHDVDDGVEEVGFAVLAAKVLERNVVSAIFRAGGDVEGGGFEVGRGGKGPEGCGEEIGKGKAYPTYDSIVAGEMGLAVLAAEDLVGVEVDVVCEPHPGRLGAAEWDNENEEELAACELCPEILAALSMVVYAPISCCARRRMTMSRVFLSVLDKSQRIGL